MMTHTPSRAYAHDKRVMLASAPPMGFKDPLLTDPNRWPMYASCKMDGFRLLIKDGILYTRKHRVFDNPAMGMHLDAIRTASKLYGLVFDGELYANPQTGFTFNDISGIFRNHNKAVPDAITYNVFDMLYEGEWNEVTPCPAYDDRIRRAKKHLRHYKYPHVRWVDQTLLANPQGALTLYDLFVQQGHEGLILRSPSAPYKHGRSTLKEGYMYKFKEAATVDGTIIGFVRRQRMKEEYRTSQARTSERTATGHQKRHKHQENYEDVDEIGSITVTIPDQRYPHAARPITTQVTLAKGLKDNNTVPITWANRGAYIGKHVEITHQPTKGHERLRMGRILRLRPDLD